MVDFKPFSLADAVKGGGNNMQTLMALAQLQRSDANARAAANRHNERMRFDRDKFDEEKRRNRAAEVKAEQARAVTLMGQQWDLMKDLAGVKTQQEYDALKPFAQKALKAMSGGDGGNLPGELPTFVEAWENIGSKLYELTDGKMGIPQSNAAGDIRMQAVTGAKPDPDTNRPGTTGPMAGKEKSAQIMNILFTYAKKRREGTAITADDEDQYAMAVAQFTAPRMVTLSDGSQAVMRPELPARFKFGADESPQPKQAVAQTPAAVPGATITPVGGKKPNLTAEENYRKATQKFEQIGTALNEYEGMLNRIGAEVLPTGDKATINSAYTNLLMELKELYNLGVLAGPDLELMHDALMPPTSWEAKYHETVSGPEALTSQLDIIRRKLDAARQSLDTAYGGVVRGTTETGGNLPSAADLKQKWGLE